MERWGYTLEFDVTNEQVVKAIDAIHRCDELNELRLIHDILNDAMLMKSITLFPNEE